MSYGVPVAEELFSTRVAKKIPSARIVALPFLFFILRGALMVINSCG